MILNAITEKPKRAQGKKEKEESPKVVPSNFLRLQKRAKGDKPQKRTEGTYKPTVEWVKSKDNSKEDVKFELVRPKIS